MNDQPLDATVPSDTKHLLAACGDAATRRLVEGLLAGATPAPVVTHCDGVEAALAQDGAALVIVPVKMGLDHLGASLQAGIAPEVALEHWRAQAEALLRACRKARRRVLLIDAGMLETRPDVCAQALGERLELHFGALPSAPAAGAERSAIHTAIAAPLLASDPKVLDLCDELEAMILGPVAPRAPVPGEIAEAARTVANLHEERDLLREQLSQMLSQTEGLRGALSRKEEEIGILRERADRAGELEDRLAQADADRAALAEERDLLRQTLAQMREETERLLVEKTDLQGKLEAHNSELADKHLLKAQVDAATRQIEAAHEAARWRDSVLGAEILKLASREREQRNAQQAANAEIARIRDSNSWKVTSPLRAVRRGLSRS